jgi:predicted esterase
VAASTSSFAGSRAALVAGSALAAALALAGPGQAVRLGLVRLDLPAVNSYALAYVPYSLDLSKPAPAIVFLHGSGATPEGWEPILEPLAEQQQFVLILPCAGQDLDFGIGADDAIVDAAIALATQQVAIDPRRIGLAGHSAGGAYALMLAYDTPRAFSGVFALGAPYRTVIALADPARVPPLRFYYGTLDPNYQAGQYQALNEMFTRLGVPQQADIAPGKGHSDIDTSTLHDGFAFLLAQPVPSCVPGPNAICLGSGRYRVEGSWDTASTHGTAGVVKLTDESGYLWFFDRANAEVTVKVLDGCGVDARHWVFAAGMTDVHVVLTVTDTVSGQQQHYESPLGHVFATVRDVNAFPCTP